MEKYLKGAVVLFHDTKYVVVNRVPDTKFRTDYQLCPLYTLERLLSESGTDSLTKTTILSISIQVSEYVGTPILTPAEDEYSFDMTRDVVVKTKFVRNKFRNKYAY